MSSGVEKLWPSVLLALVVMVAAADPVQAQRARGTAAAEDAEFGPVVRTYLGYLNAEQDVVDDRASRHEVSQAYYRRNSNRIRALRQMALRIARETQNDFLPELYAVASDELGTLFDPTPEPATFRVGEVVENTFRYLGTMRAGELFYMFARLDVYEQAELLQKQGAKPAANATAVPDAAASPPSATRPRRVNNPDPQPPRD